MTYRGKVAWITGGARIGQDIARNLAEKGCDLFLSYRTSSIKTKEFCQFISKTYGVKAIAFHVDTTKSSSVKKATTMIGKTFGRLDFLINLASIYEKTPLEKLSEKNWLENISANLGSAYYTVLHSVALLKKSKGRVVHFSDWVAASGRPRYKSFIPYYTAKMGVIGITQAQALELAPEVLVNAIAPGPIMPAHGATKKENDDVVLMTPLKKWGGAGAISKAVLFLLETDFVTGECIRVDGGRHLF